MVMGLLRYHESQEVANSACAGAVAEKLDLGIVLRKRAHVIGSTLRDRTVSFKSKLVAAFQVSGTPCWRTWLISFDPVRGRRLACQATSIST